MKAASLVGYFGAGSGWFKVAAEKAEAERMRKALVCLKAAALVKEPYSPVLLASMSFHCRATAVQTFKEKHSLIVANAKPDGHCGFMSVALKPAKQPRCSIPTMPAQIKTLRVAVANVTEQMTHRFRLACSCSRRPTDKAAIPRTRC